MNDEYLWSKKGNDREIERLEDLLSEFRFVPGPASEAPAAKQVVVKERTRGFRWVFAFAAPAFAALLIAVWIFIPAKQGTVQSRATRPSSDIYTYVPPSPPPAEQITAPAGAQNNQILRKPRPTMVRTVFRSHRSKRDQIESLVAKTQLSAEEKYAYDRLMLALSIAGTKLKVVQDTIDRKTDIEKSSLRNEK